MKKFIVSLCFLLLLSACVNNPSTIEPNIKEEDVELNLEPYVFERSYEYLEYIERFDTNNVKINNDSDATLNSDILNVFYSKSKYVPYIDFENYINLMSSALSSDVSISYDENYGFWRVEMYGDTLDFDFRENTISGSSMDIIDACFNSSSGGGEFVSNLNRIYNYSDESLDESEGFVVHLEDYKLKMYYDEEAQLVPLHLLTYFFGAYDSVLLYDGDDAFYSDELGSLASETNTEVAFDDVLVEYNDNVTDLIFDNFYGLQSLTSDSADIINNTEVGNDYLDSFEDAILDLDDGHTYILSSLYGDTDGLTPKEEEIMLPYYRDYYDLSCNDEDDLSANEISDSTVIITVNGLDSESFPVDYVDVVAEYSDFDNIVLDLRCNFGGYLFNAFVMTYPFVDGPIDSYMGDVLGGKTKLSFDKVDSEEYYSDTVDVYLLTSKYSFSAANYTAALFYDNEIGTIIGEQSGGGACAVDFVFLPNGTVISMSGGSSLLFYEDGDLVEDGVPVSIEIDIYSDDFESELLEVVE